MATCLSSKGLLCLGLYLARYFDVSFEWITSDNDVLPSIGGISFAIGGCWLFLVDYENSMKGNKKKELSVSMLGLALLCGISQYCFGGGFRDSIIISIAIRTWIPPWFVSSLSNVIQLIIIALIIMSFIYCKKLCDTAIRKRN